MAYRHRGEAWKRLENVNFVEYILTASSLTNVGRGIWRLPIAAAILKECVRCYYASRATEIGIWDARAVKYLDDTRHLMLFSRQLCNRIGSFIATVVGCFIISCEGCSNEVFGCSSWVYVVHLLFRQLVFSFYFPMGFRSRDVYSQRRETGLILYILGLQHQ